MKYEPGDKVLYSKPRRSWAEGGWFDLIPCTYVRVTFKRHTIQPDSGGRPIHVGLESITPAHTSSGDPK